MSANLEGGTGTAGADVSASVGMADLDGGFLDTFGIESPTALETPLPSDAGATADAGTEIQAAVETGQANNAGEGEVKTDADTAATQAALDAAAVPAGTEAPAEVGLDPDLTPDEKKLVAALPESDRPEGVRRMKMSRFEDHFKDPEKSRGEVADYLFKQSDVQARALQDEMVQRAISDPVAFARSQFEKDPEAYGKFVTTLFQGDPKFFAKEFTGRDDVTAEQVREWLDFFDKHKDQITSNTETEDLSTDEYAELDDVVPEIAAKIRAKLAEPAAIKEENKVLQAKLEKLQGGKEQQLQAANADLQRQATEIRQIEDESYNSIESAIVRDLIEAPVDKGGLGLAISDHERSLAPEVAAMKESIVGILRRGGVGNMQDFERDFGQWGENGATKEEFGSAAKAWSHFVNAREKHNAIDVAQTRLLPFARSYFAERAAHPTIKAMLGQLQALTTKVAAAPAAGEKFVPGHAAAVSKPGPESFEDMLDNFSPV